MIKTPFQTEKIEGNMEKKKKKKKKSEKIASSTTCQKITI